MPRSLVCNSRYVSAEARGAFGVPDEDKSVDPSRLPSWESGAHAASQLRPRARDVPGPVNPAVLNACIIIIILRVDVALGSYGLRRSSEPASTRAAKLIPWGETLRVVRGPAGLRSMITTPRWYPRDGRVATASNASHLLLDRRMHLNEAHVGVLDGRRRSADQRSASAPTVSASVAAARRRNQDVIWRAGSGGRSSEVLYPPQMFVSALVSARGSVPG